MRGRGSQTTFLIVLTARDISFLDRAEKRASLYYIQYTLQSSVVSYTFAIFGGAYCKQTACVIYIYIYLYNNLHGAGSHTGVVNWEGYDYRPKADDVYCHLKNNGGPYSALLANC